MKVSIKELGVPLEIESKGIEFEIRTPDGQKHLGTLQHRIDLA